MVLREPGPTVRAVPLLLPVLFLLVFSFPRDAAAQERSGMMGFTAESADQERAMERIMAAQIDAGRMGEYHRAITREPHHAGTETNYEYGVYLRDRLREFGFETEMYRYDILVPWIVEPAELTLLEPERIEIQTVEPAIPEDPDTYVEGGLPPMNAYVQSGDVTGELVYVNYGRIQDYRKLEEMGISLEGRIAMVRYGGSPGQMRGMKVREAGKRGAVGVIVYSDPEEDGYTRGETYPDGKWRPPTGVERGSMLDVPIYPGDPLTPGRPSIEGVERIPMDEAASIQKIPSHPISYGEAQKLLRHIGGPVAPEEWRGALPLTYHVGPGPARVRLNVQFDYAQRPVWNVIGRIEGSEQPEKVILAAGHRDAWVNGGRDPTSGAVSLLETARGIGEAVRQGYRPRRTIAIGSWGGEDFFLLGSTEYGEQFADELRENMVVYINRESYTAGSWGASGNHSLERFVVETSKDAPHPSGTSLYEAWRERQGGPIHLRAMGSGSDYTVFIHHLGVPSLSLGYGSGQGLYHSLYDTYVAFQKYLDPGYEYGTDQADMVGRMMMRLAGSEVIPFEFTATADAVAGYLEELQEMDREDRLHDELSQVARANAAMRAAAARANREIGSFLDRGADAVSSRRNVAHDLNELLMQADRDFLDERGLTRRPWYKNLLYAPGYYTGYASKPLPGIREAIEDEMWDEARKHAGWLVEALGRATETLNEAAEVARTGTPPRTE